MKIGIWKQTSWKANAKRRRKSPALIFSHARASSLSAKNARRYGIFGISQEGFRTPSPGGVPHVERRKNIPHILQNGGCAEKALGMRASQEELDQRARAYQKWRNEK